MPSSLSRAYRPYEGVRALALLVRAVANRWVCPTCRTGVDTLHCPRCGEKALQPKDLTFLGLMTQVFHGLSSIDSRLLRSLKVLLTRPGAITNAYVLGPRKPYIGPFQLFLIVNVVFFAVQAFARVADLLDLLIRHSRMHWSRTGAAFAAGSLTTQKPQARDCRRSSTRRAATA